MKGKHESSTTRGECGKNRYESPKRRIIVEVIWNNDKVGSEYKSGRRCMAENEGKSAHLHFFGYLPNTFITVFMFFSLVRKIVVGS